MEKGKVPATTTHGIEGQQPGIKGNFFFWKFIARNPRITGKKNGRAKAGKRWKMEEKSGN
jgi:hypothetical protein